MFEKFKNIKNVKEFYDIFRCRIGENFINDDIEVISEDYIEHDPVDPSWFTWIRWYDYYIMVDYWSAYRGGHDIWIYTKEEYEKEMGNDIGRPIMKIKFNRNGEVREIED